MIYSLGEKKAITGLAVLNCELYVRYSFSTEDITVYDTRTFSVSDRLQVPGLGNVRDLTSCKRYQCDYISDWSNCSVHRIENKRNFTQWSVDDVPSGLSVTATCNLLVTCCDLGKVMEFTTEGNLLREIVFQSCIVHPWHTIELNNRSFVVCHGSDHDLLHRVCLVDPAGRLMQSYGGFRGLGDDHLNAPIRLALVNNSIFVCDQKNHRILVLGQSLKNMREVISGLRWPLRMCHDLDTNQLHVADNIRHSGRYVNGDVKVYCVQA